MRFSQVFTKTRKEVPAEEVARNAQLLIRAGYIYKEMAGVYGYLPLGLMVVEKIKKIIRDEMNGLGGQELIMTNLQRQDLWEQTKRWDDKTVDIWFKSALKNGQEVGLAWSHEEPITIMMKDHIASYRDLPVQVYQFQTKLRNETRAKSGIMRTREFVMKDLYSYSLDEGQHKELYDKVTAAYHRIFDEVGLGSETFFTFASGGAFTQFSHEFQTVTDAGEDTIYLDRSKKIAVNEEVYTPRVLKQLGLEESKLEKVKAAEVGNIFSFGTSKCEELGLVYTDEHGKVQPVVLGSYGIGIGRLMGVIVEHFSDEHGLVWPEAVAPFHVHLLFLGSAEAQKAADQLYSELNKTGISVIYDDRKESAGNKLNDAELLGIPHRVVVSDKTIEAGKYEHKLRQSKTTKLLGKTDLLKQLSKS